MHPWYISHHLTLACSGMKIVSLSPWFALLGFITLSNADLLDDILTALKNAVDCTSCHALLIPLQQLAHMGNHAFSDTFTTICETLKVCIKPFP
jgi:sphingomyelin phosphodiesterase